MVTIEVKLETDIPTEELVREVEGALWTRFNCFRRINDDWSYKPPTVVSVEEIPMKKVHVITKLVNCGGHCPTQWEGEMDDGKGVYIRYRWGSLSVEIDGILMYCNQIGDGMDGVLSFAQLKETLEATKEFVLPSEEIF